MSIGQGVGLPPLVNQQLAASSFPTGSMYRSACIYLFVRVGFFNNKDI